MKGRNATLGARCWEAVALACADEVDGEDVCAIDVCADEVIASADTKKIVDKVRLMLAGIA